MPDREKDQKEKTEKVVYVENIEAIELEDKFLDEVSGGFTDNCNCTIKADTA